MKELLMYIQMKLKEEKGEVSVEWALVAVIMCVIILATFMPGVTGALAAGIASITAALTTAAG